MELVAADIGGTHARFALADVADGRVLRLDEPITLKTADCDSLAGAWETLSQRMGRPLPRAAALAAASPFGAAQGGLTADIWTLSTRAIEQQLGLDAVLVLNDFGAIAHAVQQVGPEHLQHLCGPDAPLPDLGLVTICGPGTGIGCVQLNRRQGGYDVIETEGGHIGFAPNDAHEDAVVQLLRQRHGRASAERVCSGEAIVAHYEVIAKAKGWTLWEASTRYIWDNVLFGEGEEDCVEAADRLCAALGSVAGDLALAQGADAVVIAGGLGLRLKDRLPSTRFAERFVAKGRFESLMERLPVKLITHPEPGLFGAAAAYAQRFR